MTGAAEIRPHLLGGRRRAAHAVPGLPGMRVLMFGWEFPPFVAGGLATATVGLVKGLLRNAVDVTLVVPFPVTESPLPGLRLVSVGDVTADRLSVHRIRTPVRPYEGEAEYVRALAELERARPGTAALYGADLLAEVDRYAGLATVVAASEPHDVIDVHDWMTFAAGIAARRVSGRPLVAHIHATEHDRQGEGANPAICEQERLGLLLADRVIANSNATKEACVQEYGVPADRIHVIHWGIDPDGLAEPPTSVSPLRLGPEGRRPPTVLFLGRVTRQKGPDYFIEVAGRVAPFVPEARFVVAGGGDLLPKLMNRAAELGIAGRVFFTGGVQGEDVTRLYRMADVCVMPSVSEPFGLVALESIAQGTPCVVPRRSGVAEVVRNAFKIDFWDIEEMTDVVVSLLRHRALGDELSEEGRRELTQSRFGLDEPARLTRDVYADAITATTPVS